MLSRFKDVKESVMLADGKPTPYLTYYLIWFISLSNTIPTCCWDEHFPSHLR